MYARAMRPGFLSIIALLVAVALIAVIQGDWLVGLLFVVMAGAFVWLQMVVDRRRRR
jgi:asparagine N-glycosylation enzyme membrane subunit Stt3